MKVALRAALIWHDEVMSDVVVDKPTKLTIGSSPQATFVVPDLGLPDEFAIVTPGERGYLLVLGDRMAGTISIDGAEHAVAELVQRSGEPFHALPISQDWGLVDLDPSGAYKLFFQFVEVEDAQPLVTKPVLVAGVAGWAFASLVLTLLWLSGGFDLDEAALRGVALSTVSLIVGGIAWSILRQDSESQASLAFSIALHAAVLFMTYQLYDAGDAYAAEPQRPLAGDYLPAHIDQAPPPPPAVAATTKSTEPEAVAVDRQSLPPAPPPPRPPGPRVWRPGPAQQRDHGPLGAGAHILDTVVGGETRNPNGDKVTKAPGEKPGGRTTRGDGDGDGDGSGDGSGDGTAGKHTDGPPGGVHVDKPRDCVGAGCTHHTGPRDPGTITPLPPIIDDELDREEIKRIVQSRKGLFQFCYQNVLDHGHPELAGTVVTKFVISGGGAVTRADVTGGTLNNDDVSACIARNLRLLKFPAKPPGGIVIYPFAFAHGGR